MGQPITVQSQVVGGVALYDTDRSITGQDGGGFGSTEEADGAAGLPAQLAGRILGADPAISHVFVHSNSVSVDRDGGWEPAQVDAIGDVIHQFFIFYNEHVDAS